MEQVVRNLVENAVKYSPDGGKIVIASRITKDKIVVSVADEGIGIAPQHRDKVFDRFYRIDHPLPYRMPGSGLGLSITKGHIEAHGGEAWLKSTPGKGSTFYFSLPLNEEENK